MTLKKHWKIIYRTMSKQLLWNLYGTNARKKIIEWKTLILINPVSETHRFSSIFQGLCLRSYLLDFWSLYADF